MILVFSGFLTGQIVFDYLSLDAGPQSTEITRLSAYTGYFNEYFSEQKQEKKEGNLANLTVVTFWASWCSPCLQELMALKEVQKTLGSEKLKIMAINGDEIDQDKKIQMVSNDLGLQSSIEIVKDGTGFYFDKFNVSALPFTVLYKNNVAYKILNTEDILDQQNFTSFLKNIIN